MSFQNKDDDSFHHRLSAPALWCNQVEFSYPGVPVLSSVSFSIPYPGLSVIVGPNGGGKSTLLKLALGLLTPQAGSLEVFGTIPHRVCAHVGYVPQHTTLKPDFPISVVEAVAMGCQNRREPAEAALESVGLLDLAKRSFAALSGGQRQRVLIARALAGGSKLLLLDEPTSAVDPAFAEQVRELVVELSKKIAVLVVSHDLLFVEKRTDQIIFLNHTAQTLTAEDASNGCLWDLYRQHAKGPHE